MANCTQRAVAALVAGCCLAGVRTAAGGGVRHVAFPQRLDRGRRNYALTQGASADSEASVDEALSWLAGSQEADGRWKGGKRLSDAAATGYAVLAFLGAGQTEKQGEHVGTVRKAVKWIVGRQKRSGAIGGATAKVSHDHAVCTLALVEACGMAEVLATKRAAKKALDFTAAVFEKTDYRRDAVPDPVVTGLSVMTGKAALLSCFPLSPMFFTGAMSYVDRHMKRRGHRTDAEREHKRGTVATAFALMLLGFKSDDPRIIGRADPIMRCPPEDEFAGKATDWEHLQFASLVMFQLGGDYRAEWLGALRDLLVERQRTGPGEIAGSWDFSPGDYSDVGRAYATAMGALCLEAYYRYRPIFKSASRGALVPAEREARDLLIALPEEQGVPSASSEIQEPAIRVSLFWVNADGQRIWNATKAYPDDWEGRREPLSLEGAHVQIAVGPMPCVKINDIFKRLGVLRILCPDSSVELMVGHGIPMKVFIAAIDCCVRARIGRVSFSGLPIPPGNPANLLYEDREGSKWYMALPVAAAKLHKESELSSPYVTLNVTRDGSMYVDGTKGTLDRVVKMLANKAAASDRDAEGRPKLAVRIRTDSDVELRMIDTILNCCFAEGLADVRFATTWPLPK